MKFRPIDYTISEFELNLLAADLPDGRASIVEELGPSGERFLRTVEMHLNKSPSKALRDLEIFENRLLEGKIFSDFTHWQLRVAGTVVRAAIGAVPAKGKPGPRRGAAGSVAYQLLSHAASVAQPILEAETVKLFHSQSTQFATELADNVDWLEQRADDLAELPRQERIESIARSIRGSAKRLANEQWAKALSPQRGKSGIIGRTVQLLKTAEPHLSPAAKYHLFGDASAPEAEDGRGIPLDAAVKSFAVQKSKKKRAM